MNKKYFLCKGRYPWLVALRTSNGYHFCGGALISDIWVLTAAHCQFSKFGDIIVAKTLKREEGEVIFKADKVIDHPNAKKNKFGIWEDDFQLLRLTEKVNFDDELSPICLPSKDANFKEQKCWLAGWGRTSAYPKRYAPILQETLERGSSFALFLQIFFD